LGKAFLGFFDHRQGDRLIGLIDHDDMMQDEPILIFQDTGVDTLPDRHASFALAEPFGVGFK
jgi:hypothetical protein